MTIRRIQLHDEKGQTMTEFAIILPILCLLLFGIIQFGILFNNYVTLTDATRAGARKGAVSRQASNPRQACIDQVKYSGRDLDQSKLTVDCQSTWQPASDVTVIATYPYSINLMGVVIASGTLKSTTQERVE
ncbi:MAG TPA: TadE family protein [Gaiellaceae bacterium]|jgi:Flp pilus assembly protein TadG|nr:TadE family protein [Gaiellaceae bacterium]